MKKSVTYIILFLFSFLAFSQDYIVKINFQNDNYEITNNNKIIKSLPFSKFCGYKTAGNKIYFIDITDSRISDYGKLCCFNTKTNKMEYTNLNTGVNFCITKDNKYAVITTPFESSEENDIDDIFNVGVPAKKVFVLNVELYNLENETLLKKFNFESVFNNENIKFYTVDINQIDHDKISVEYGLEESGKSLFKGYINLSNFNFMQEK